MNLLIVRLSALGDVIQGIPCLVALKETFPNWRISWLVEAPSAPILENHPHLDRLFILRKDWRQRGGRASLKHLLGATADIGDLVKELRRAKFDAAIDLQGLFKSGMWCELSGAPRRIGYNNTREFAHLFLNEYVSDRPTFDPTYPLFERYVAPAVYLGADHTKARYLLPPATEATVSVTNTLLGLPRKPLIAFCPWSAWPSKNWSLKSWQSLAHKLLPDFNLILVGATGDREAAAEWVKAVPGIQNLTGQTSLPILAEIFRRCQVVVGPDSGPLHLANAVNVPRIVMLFGSTSWRRSGPIGTRHVSLSLDLSCQPCFERLCPLKHQNCLHLLDWEQVDKTIRQLV